MKKILYTVTLIAGLSGLVAFEKPAKEDTYKVDLERSHIEWTAAKVGGSHNGTVKLTQGTLTLNGKSLVKGSFLIDMGSITSDNARVTAHLKNDDFFSVDKNPSSKFEITKVSPAAGGRVNVTGNLTIKGSTHPISFPATVKQEKGVVVAVANGVKVDRTRYDIKYRSKSFFGDIGDKAIDDEFVININLVAKK